MLPAAVNRFLDLLRGAPARALLLDYDGTLAPFRVDRGEAVPYPGVREALRRLVAATDTRLAIVTGRTVDDAIPLLGLDPAPEVFGAHGRERRRADGSRSLVPPAPGAEAALARALDWCIAQGLWSAERVEKKPGSIALHWRGLPSAEVEALRARALPIFRSPALELIAFDGGLEARAPGVTKGDAVRAVLAESPPGVAIAFLGDDRTDEDAFEALGERGLALLVRPERRETRAHAWIRPPAELLRFLDLWTERARP